MTSLNPLALTYESVLRALTTTPEKSWTLSSLAGAAGKDKSTLRRALPAMREADLIGPEPDFTLGQAGRAALALLDGGAVADEANVVREPSDAPEGYAALDHALIVPDHLNPREAFDEEALEELAASIRENGVLQNLVVRPAAPMEGYGQPMHRLVAGERRWRAIGLLIKRGHWHADHKVPVKIADLDDTGHAVIALLENLQRKDLKPLEEARAFKRLVEHHNFKTADIAGRINATQRVVQQRLQLLELDANDQQRLDEGKINLEQARQILAWRPKPFNLSAPEALMLVEIAYRVRKGRDTITYRAIPIGDASGDATLRALTKAGLARHTADWNTGQLTVSLDYNAPRALAEVTGIGDPETGELAVAGMNLRVAAELIPAEGATFVTPWLNEPYAFDEERLAQIEQRKIDDAERAQQQAEAREFQQSLKAQTKALEADLRAGVKAVCGGELATALAALGVTLPLYVKEDEIVDATGVTLMDAPYHGLPHELRLPALRLLALTLNAAFGFPEPPEGALAAQTDEDFNDVDADDETACEICGDPLDDTGACANCVAEDAEAADDDDLSPAAKKLVGVE